MKRLLILKVFLLFLLTPMLAHSQSIAWIGDLGFEADGGLGYKFPVITTTQNLQVYLGDRWELNANFSYDYAHKIGLNSGHETAEGGGLIFWVTPWFGLNPTFDYATLTTSAYHKSAWEPDPGIVFRAKPLGLPSRIYVVGSFPVGPKIDASTGIENENESSVQASWLARMGSPGPFDVWLGFGWGVFHGHEQGNPQCDGTYGPTTCARTPWTTGNATLTLSFEFPKTRDPNRDW